MIAEDNWDGWFVTERKGIVVPLMANQEPRAYSAPKSTEELMLMRQATDWFVRLGAPDVSAEERKKFEAWRLQSDAHAQAFREVAALWSEPELETAVARSNQSWPASQCESRRFGFPAWKWGTAAAVVVLTCAAWFLHEDLWNRWLADFRTATAEQRTVELPDHSTALLNTDSAIAVDFNGGARQVRLLRGEALFTVQPDPERPFVVHSGSTTARAVGTAFVVRSREGDAVVTVTKGVVEVSEDRHASSPVRLAQGQQVVSTRDGLGSVRTVDLDIEASWARGQLVFVRTALADVLEEVKRYYPGYVVLLSPESGRVPVTGIYKISDPARILSILTESLHLKMTRLSDRLVVLH